MLLTKAESVAALKSGYVTTDRLRLVKRDDEVLLDYPKSKLPQVLLTSLLALTLLYFLIDYISKGHPNRADILLAFFCISILTFVTLVAVYISFMIKGRRRDPVLRINKTMGALSVSIGKQSAIFDKVAGFAVYSGRTFAASGFLEGFAHSYTHIFATPRDAANRVHLFTFVEALPPFVRMRPGGRRLDALLREISDDVSFHAIDKSELLHEAEFLKHIPTTWAHVR